MKAIADTLGLARSNLVERAKPARLARRRGRPALPEAEIVAEVRQILGERPSYGYRRLHAVLRRRQMARGEAPVNHKRIYRIAKAHGLLLARHTGIGADRRHDGRVAVRSRNTRWCSDGFEIACDNGERVRVAFSLDCCDRQSMAWVATTGGITAEHIRDLMLTSIERRFGSVRMIHPIEWLNDNGSCYIAHETRRFARELGFIPRTTPVRSPQSNGMAEAFVKTFKRDYVQFAHRPDADTVIRQLAQWFEDYNENHPHKALKYRSPNQFIQNILATAA